MTNSPNFAKAALPAALFSKEEHEERVPAPNDGRHCLVCMERLWMGQCAHSPTEIAKYEAEKYREPMQPQEQAKLGVDSAKGEAILEKLRARKAGAAAPSSPQPAVPPCVYAKAEPPAGDTSDRAAAAAVSTSGVPQVEVTAREAESLDLERIPQFSVLCGSAGVGKTFQAKRIQELDGAELCATTGIAAMNLGPGVTTLNSLLGYFDTESLRDMWISGKLTSKLGRLYDAGCRRIVIDEFSMLGGSQLAILCQAIDDLGEQNRGFKMGLTLCGDPVQLPPVKDLYAFEVDEFARFLPGVTKLTKVWRQSDADFIEALRAVRRGDRSAALDYFGPKIERTLLQEFEGTTILAKNDEVDRYNQMRHAMVQGARHAWVSSRWGKERSEWKNVPPALQLKEGALVMVLANCKELDEDLKPTGEYIYVNGDLGIFQGLAPGGYARVKLNRGAEVSVAQVTRENLVPCDSARRKELRLSNPDKLRGDRQQWEALGAVTYMPLRLAFSTTCHKSQGLTLDAVQMSIANHMWETPGLLYVALSRARTAAGLRIVGSKELLAKRIVVEPKVRAWL